MIDRWIRMAEPTFYGNEISYVMDTVTRRRLSAGPMVAKFEQAFASRVGGHAVATSSGTSALHAALAACGVGPGDEVVVPATTYIATLNAVKLCGATPVIVDVREDTWTIAWTRALTPSGKLPRAYVPVHLYGVVVPSPAYLPVAPGPQSGAPLFIEDGAEAHGAVGVGWGTAQCYSFYANKILTTGEGGIVTTQSRDLAARVRDFVRHGTDQPFDNYRHSTFGTNARMTEMQAAIGLGQVETMTKHLITRRTLEVVYDQHLPKDLPRQHRPEGSAPWVYPVLVPNRDLVRKILAENGIESRPVFHPLHLQASVGGSPQSLPVSERLGRDGLLLPLHCGMTSADVRTVCVELTRILESLA